MSDLVSVRYELDDRHAATWRDEVCDRMLDAESALSAGTRLGVSFGVTAIRGVIHLDCQAYEAGLTIARSPERVARSSTPPTMGLTLVTSGEAQVRTAGRDHVVRAGELCLLSSIEPFQKQMSADYHEQFLYLPVPIALALGRPVPLLSQRALVAPRRGLGGVLADAMLSVARCRGEMSVADWETALGAVFELASGVFGRAEPERTGNATRVAQHARALRYLEAHLAEPALSPTTIAAGLGMSLRYLHLLFERGESVGATILGRRLERCHAALRDDHDPRSISEIAFAWGFNDAAHFSRTFRARFGVSPRELRASR
ncbi:MAG TPA: helix-turn-helix domain-containing protein [Kofleriaceae bacterium]|nr:helix-turn-helix domain-containing protein [Kofleriaceae bacterium]